MLVHTPTLFLVLTALSILAAGSFWFEASRAGAVELYRWAQAFLFAAALGFSSLLLFPSYPTLAVLLPTVFSFLALTQIHRGLAVHFGLRASRWIVLPVLVWLALSLTRWLEVPVEASYWERRVALCSIYLVYSFATIRLLWQVERAAHARHMLMTVYGVFGTFYAVRLAVLQPRVVPSETALADFWLTASIYMSSLFIAATSFLLHSLWRDNAEQVLRHAADADPLTGLSNRRAFTRSVERALAADQPAVLALVDLDHFKAVNDTCGHGVGDAVLREFADLLRSALKPGDSCARIGGEEFSILMRGETVGGASRRLSSLAADYRRRAEAGFALPRAATFSAGLVGIGKGHAFDDMFERADQALYRAKHTGRDRVVVAKGAGEQPVPQPQGKATASSALS